MRGPERARRRAAAEGFRSAPIPMIEVYRPALGRPMLWPDCPFVVAVATEGVVACPLPLLDLAAPAAVASFVLAHLARTDAAR